MDTFVHGLWQSFKYPAANMNGSTSIKKCVGEATRNIELTLPSFLWMPALYCCGTVSYTNVYRKFYTGLFISPSGISELDCATTKTDTAERSISIGRESLQVLFVLGALAYFQVLPLGGSRDEKWRSQ